MKKSPLLLGLFLAVLAGVVALIGLLFNEAGNAAVTDFESCVDAGNPVLESYPAQCVAEDGTRYIQPTPTPAANTAGVEDLRY